MAIDQEAASVCAITSGVNNADAAPTAGAQEGNNVKDASKHTVVEGPISSLPEEILTSILNILVHERSNQGADFRPTIPIVASKVSKFWRFVALQNPLWWCHIFISPPWKLDAIRTFLERSKDCPLDLRISVHSDYHIIHEKDGSLPALDDYQVLRTILSPHFRRCRVLHIQGVFQKDQGFLPHLLEPLMEMDMPFLEEFIFDGEFSYEVDKFERRPLFSSAPKLLDVRLGGIGAMQYSPPLSTLTALHLSRAMNLTNLSFSELSQILTSCACLTFFAVYDDLLNAWPGKETTCSVPLLESLYILGNMLSVSELLLFLSAPKLRELVIAPVVGGDLTALRDETRHGLPLFPLLTSLTLAPAHSEAFQEALPTASACFPQIETLILANLYLSEFIDTFTKSPSILFPKLQSLALTDVDKEVARAVHAIALFRMTQNVPLHNIFVDSESLRVFRPATSLSSLDTWDRFEVKEGNLWENQRLRGLYSDIKDLFVGRPSGEW